MNSTPDTTAPAQDTDSIGHATFVNVDGQPVTAGAPTRLDIAMIEQFQDLEDPAAVLELDFDAAA